MAQRTLIEQFLALLRAQKAPRYYKTVEDGYLLGIGVGAGGREIGGEEYAQIDAAIAAKPAPPEGYDYRLREDLQWQLFVLPEPEEETLDPAEALKMICGKSALTRTEAVRFQTELKSAREKEKSEG